MARNHFSQARAAAARSEPSWADLDGQVRSDVEGDAARLLRPAAAANGLFGSFADFARSVHDRDMVRLDRSQAVIRAAGLRESVPSEGGFLVPGEFSDQILEGTLQQAVVRSRATVVPMSSLVVHVPAIDDVSHAGGAMLGGVTGAWMPEAADLSQAASQPALGRVRLEARKLTALWEGVPNELLEDATAWDMLARTFFPKALAQIEDGAFTRGSGSGEPEGFLNARCAITVGRAQDGTITQADLSAMKARLLVNGRTDPSTAWVASGDAIAALESLFTLAGSTPVAASMWVQNEPDGSPGSTGVRLLGIPLLQSEWMYPLGTTGDIALLKRSEYVVGDRKLLDLQAAASGRGFSLDETDWRMVNRVDGRMWRTQPYTPVNGGATQSSVVILGAAS